MQLATSFEQRHFFSKNGYIEFEGLLSAEESSLLLEKSTARDLWRQDSKVKKISLRPQFAEIAATLARVRDLRIGFDERVHPGGSRSLLESSLKPIICIAFFLSGEKAGNGVVFLPENPIPEMEEHFLISYSAPKTLYRLHPKDPFTHELKKLGYVFGDLLKNDTHPLLTRH